MAATIHGTVAVALLLYMLVLGLWGIVAFARGSGVSSGYRASLATGELLAVAQVLLGGGLLLLGVRPPTGIHYLYGILTPLMLPFMYGLTRGHPSRRAALGYGAAALFTVALILRAFATG